MEHDNNMWPGCSRGGTTTACVCAVIVATVAAMNGCGDPPPRRGEVARHRSSLPIEPDASSWPRPGRLVLTQVPVAADANQTEATSGPGLLGGSRIVVVDLKGDGAPSARLLTPGFAAAGSPDLSFDAGRLLFVGRRGTGAAAVWEVNLDGTGLRLVTACPGGCAEAIYLSTIFTIDAPAPVDQIAFLTAMSDETPAAIYTCGLDGSNARRITFAPQGVSDPLLLQDGRLAFAMPTQVDVAVADTPAPDSTSFFTVNTDGTDIFPFAGLHEHEARRGEACETPDGWVVYVERTDGGAGGGSLVSVRRTRSLRSRRVIARAADGTYRNPSPLSERFLLVSYRRGTASTSGSFGVFALEMDSGGHVTELFDDPDWHEIDARAVAPRPKPPGRSSVVDHTKTTCQLYCLNAYVGDRGAGASARSEQIAAVRIFAATHSGGTSPSIRTALLGEANVAADGSFFVELPARIPIRLETVNPSGGVLASMGSWFWVMPGERRGCIGCHEDRELTPPNRHVYALRKPPQRIGPTGLTGAAQEGSKGRGPEISP